MRLVWRSALGAAGRLALVGVLMGSLAACLLGPGFARAAGDQACKLEPGTTLRKIDLAGSARRYWVWGNPRTSGAAPAPVVFLWHGWGGSPQSMMRLVDPRLWGEAIFVAAEGLPRLFPGLGSRRLPGWQIESGEFDDRDLKLFDAIVKTLRSEHCIDPTRIYSAGFSNGAYFSNLLGCERSDMLAAIAPVSGGGPRATSCGGPVPVLLTHGRSDQIVPHREGERSFEAWKSENECEGEQRAATGSCVDGAACSADVRFCSFSGGHTWPRDTAKRIIAFLQAHARQR